MSTLNLQCRAMALAALGARQLVPTTLAMRGPRAGQVLLRVHCCGVCRTDLHIVDGDLPLAQGPRVPGHEVVGTVVSCGSGAERFAPGTRVGVPWLHRTCGDCRWCPSGRENLCESADFTGWIVDGSYAEYPLADESFCFRLPARCSDEQAAPLLCAGLIGWRALRVVWPAQRLGLYGFGAAGHLIAQVALQQGRSVFALMRPGDLAAQALARSLGVQWNRAAGPPQPPGSK